MGIMIPQEQIHTATRDDMGTQSVAPISLDDRVREFEAGLISWALEVSRGNKSKAARLLKIKRSTLGDRINRCGLGGGHAPASGVDLTA
jgi:DNA-binding NtrC family response regulator